MKQTVVVVERVWTKSPECRETGGEHYQTQTVTTLALLRQRTTSYSMSWINAKKPQQLHGGGLLSSTPAPPPRAASSSDDHDLEIVASTIVSTSTDDPGTQRRRALSVDSNAIDEEEFEVPAVGKKRKVAAAPKGKGKAAQKGRGKGKEPDFVSSVPWPDHFVQLEKTFKVRVASFWESAGGVELTSPRGSQHCLHLLLRPQEHGDHFRHAQRFRREPPQAVRLFHLTWAPLSELTSPLQTTRDPGHRTNQVAPSPPRHVRLHRLGAPSRPLGRRRRKGSTRAEEARAGRGVRSRWEAGSTSTIKERGRPPLLFQRWRTQVEQRRRQGLLARPLPLFLQPVLTQTFAGERNQSRSRQSLLSLLTPRPSSPPPP